jgi:DNA mismatch endonuclease (patch repair protein)
MHRLGFRFRLATERLPGRPDFVFVRQRVAVFVDGDFWHGRQWRNRGFDSLVSHLRGIRNSAYWIRKIERNIARDRGVNRRLRAAGWRVVRVWESELKKTPERCIRRVVLQLERPNGDRESR